MWSAGCMLHMVGPNRRLWLCECVYVGRNKSWLLCVVSGAVYGGGQAVAMETKHTRKELEREVTLGMFCVRVAEMKADWLANRYISWVFIL